MAGAHKPRGCVLLVAVGDSELLGIVLALEQSSGQGYFKADHRSPVCSTSWSIMAQFLFLRGVGTH